MFVRSDWNNAVNDRFMWDWDNILEDTEPERDTLENLTLGDLSNDVHPIFARHNFVAIPRDEYDKLLPSLRLASLLIDTDCLLDFWHALWFGYEQEVSHGDGPEDTHMAYFRSKHPLSAFDRAKTRLKLLALSYMIKFHKAVLEGWDGMATRGDSQIGLAIGRAADAFGGHTTSIEFSEHWSKYFLARDDSDKHPTELTARSYFSFATVLVHEVVHAAYFSLTPEDEIPFEFHTAAEPGFEWEAFIFGGIVQFSHLENTITDWPSPATVRYYQEKRCALRNICELPNVEAHWFIPLTYVQELFTTAFWNEKVTVEGAAAVKIPRSRGQLYTVSPSGEVAICRTFQESGPLPDNVEYIGDGEVEIIAPDYEWDGFGRLIKIDPWVFGEAIPNLWKFEDRCERIARARYEAAKHLGSSNRPCDKTRFEMLVRDILRSGETEI